MATVKVKFRASSVKSKEGTLFYQVIHVRVARQINTGYKLYPREWNTQTMKIVFPPDVENNRRSYLASLQDSLYEDVWRIEKIITRYRDGLDRIVVSSTSSYI